MQIIEVRQLDTDYTDTELLEFGQQLSRAERKTSQVKEDKKRAAADFAAELKNLESEIGDLSRRIEYRRGPKPIECRVDLNQPERGQKQIWRMDTGELVSTETMTAAEMQRRFGFDDEAEQVAQEAAKRADLERRTVEAIRKAAELRAEAKAPSFADRMRAAKDTDEGRGILREMETAIAALETAVGIKLPGFPGPGWRGFSVVQPREWKAATKRVREIAGSLRAAEHAALVEDARQADEAFRGLLLKEQEALGARWGMTANDEAPEGGDHANAG